MRRTWAMRCLVMVLAVLVLLTNAACFAEEDVYDYYDTQFYSECKAMVEWYEGWFDVEEGRELFALSMLLDGVTQMNEADQLVFSEAIALDSIYVTKTVGFEDWRVLWVFGVTDALNFIYFPDREQATFFRITNYRDVAEDGEKALLMMQEGGTLEAYCQVDATDVKGLLEMFAG